MSKKKTRVKESKKKGEKKGIENTDAWNSADWNYSQLIANDMMPLLSPPLIGQDRIDYLNDILKGCPEYYPVLIELGYRYIQEGRDKDGKASIDKGLQSSKAHFSNENLIDAYYDICEFFEKHLRFETAIEYYNQLMEIESDKAKVRGNLDTAKTMLEKSLELDQEDEITVNNLKACELMLKNKLKNWEAYLLSTIDYDYLEKLQDDDDFEEYNQHIRIYNSNKIEAFKSDLVRNSNYTPTEKYDILFSLNYILNLIWESYESDYFHYDDIFYMEMSFKPIMHKFILKTKDIDDEIFNGVYTAILEFYQYLEKQKVVSGYNSLKKEMLKLKPELMEKMLKYNEIRHNDEYSDEEKDEIREELFEGDAFLPLF